MADGKWIADLTPDMPSSEAARCALQVRLQVVEDALPQALHELQSDPEPVHQLRVSTRRAAAASRIFEAYLPKKTAKRAKRILRRIRRAAGEARDWDVFLFDLMAHRQKAAAAKLAGLDYLLGYAAGQRAAAQTHLQDLGYGDRKDFKEFLKGTVDSVRARDKDADTLATLATPLLSQLLKNLETTAGGDLKKYEQLHKVRIAGKRLRYAMELFAECFDASFKEKLYPQVEAMQEILGRANDSHVAVQRLEALCMQGRTIVGAAWKPLQPGITGLLQFHRQRLPRERQAFLAWWQQWRRHSGPTLQRLIEDADFNKG